MKFTNAEVYLLPVLHISTDFKCFFSQEMTLVFRYLRNNFNVFFSLCLFCPLGAHLSVTQCRIQPMISSAIMGFKRCRENATVHRISSEATSGSFHHFSVVH